jgi:hypothetical protein
VRKLQGVKIRRKRRIRIDQEDDALVGMPHVLYESMEARFV